MSWADLDKLAVAKPRADGATTLVVRDDRTLDRMFETKHLSIVIAIARVVRGRHTLAEKYGARGSVVYLTTRTPPDFIVEAVTAAGGNVFDGKREHKASSPLATTMQLDAAFTDLASVVRRRIGARSFGAALETLQWDLRRNLPDRANVEMWWTAIIELAALTGECLREQRAARWLEAPGERLPVALDLGKGNRLFPGKLAQTIVEGGEGSMLALLEATRSVTSAATGVAMPLLCDRRAVLIEKLTWERLISEQVDTEDVPVIVYVEDQGGTIAWPFGANAPTPALRARALANLAKQPVTIELVDVPGGHKLAVVTGGFYAAESLLVPATMAQIGAELGGTKLMLVGVPARGQLVAIDGIRATLDDDLQNAFLALVEKHYLEATERDRISSEVIVYQDKPLGRVQSGLMEARRLLRTAGVDPDA